MHSYTLAKNGIAQSAMQQDCADDVNTPATRYNQPACALPHIDLPAIPPLPALDLDLPRHFLTRCGVPKTRIESILNDIFHYAAVFKRRSESALREAWSSLARMPYAASDETPLEEILQNAYILHRRVYLVELSNRICDTLVHKHGIVELAEAKPIVKVVSTETYYPKCSSSKLIRKTPRARRRNISSGRRVRSLPVSP